MRSSVCEQPSDSRWGLFIVALMVCSEQVNVRPCGGRAQKPNLLPSNAAAADHVEQRGRA